MILFPYNNTDYAFTLSNDVIKFETTNDSYFEVSLLIKHYHFYDNNDSNVQLAGGDYKIPVFNGKATWNVGTVIDRQIAFFNQPYQDEFQIKTAQVSFEIHEYNLSDDTLIETTTFNNIKFIPGPRPKIMENNIALLNVNSNPCRVTSSGNCKVSFLLPYGTHELLVLNNENVLKLIPINATALNNTYTFSLNVKDFSVKPADVITFKITGTSIEKKFIVFPEAQLSNTLWYVNKHKVLNSLELTGEYYFPDKYDQTTHSYKRGVNEVTEVIEVKNKPSIKINTGYILKNQVKLVDELLRSNNVFLKNIEGSNLEMIPVAKKRTGYNSKNFTYSYDLEFIINKTTDA